jgi:hypothetical protein
VHTSTFTSASKYSAIGAASASAKGSDGAGALSVSFASV